ncbi:MAG: lysine 2,3-aminomutase [Deltaproteobacteria bacterium RIFCSPLOWO2_12_FULL_43_16]|nr:MAG: lysine 2,3-aminomutase [Deltaproteobacteria bacterium GWA2_43_19]OGQ10564.1 MAG: lysine 2,3-aminomutase [Deltaproteobacteria bacterium RIFCSPHIGHO2_02_FULL_43_33]OGQ59585.1 MAG: lysine 2,3-aminomutase [Deltaproteobacteria bacterium RIFCSPLOWO2_12_FULL_43_16]HBR16937.1 lysine 2,3-aminomutase [Deltaproteobacteria bacterium]
MELSISSEPPSSNLARNCALEFEDSRYLQEWKDWKWQLKNRITTLEELKKLISLTPSEEEGIKRSKGRLAMAITPYFFSLIDKANPNCPIRKQAIPRIEEFSISTHDLVDPCGEDNHSPVPGLVHRYPDRVLLLVTDSCAMYCRYCTRRRMVGEEMPPMSIEQFDAAYKYIKSKRAIRDVLISGGDPLMLKTEHLEYYLKKLRSISHLDIIRLGTRVPVTLPMRMDKELVDMLKKYHPVYMSIHFSHPREITQDVKDACAMSADAGIPLGSQTVLLKGINDKPSVMKRLMQELLRIRVRPYYIYQCDMVTGTGHFRTPVSVGINIIEKLRGHTSGYAVPTFVVDAPGGGGKIPVGPTYLISQAKDRVTLRNYQGNIFEYFEDCGER